MLDEVAIFTRQFDARHGTALYDRDEEKWISVLIGREHTWMDNHKPAESLDVADLSAHPVWMFVNDDSLGETVVRPVQRVPVTNLSGKLVGTRVRLANGTVAWALMGNISPRYRRMTEQHLSLSVEHNGRWFHLARYFDPDYESRGPDELADFLGLSVSDVFPIAYDLRSVAKGDAEVLVGAVTREPRERLTREARMAKNSTTTSGESSESDPSYGNSQIGALGGMYRSLGCSTRDKRLR
jgi:hypothetical protein